MIIAADTRGPFEVEVYEYSGNVTNLLGKTQGPNAHGEVLTVVAAEYDPEADQTRVGFTFQRIEPSL